MAPGLPLRVTAGGWTKAVPCLVFYALTPPERAKHSLQGPCPAVGHSEPKPPSRCGPSVPAFPLRPSEPKEGRNMTHA